MCCLLDFISTCAIQLGHMSYVSLMQIKTGQGEFAHNAARQRRLIIILDLYSMENVSLSVATGLTEAQAQRRLQTEGLNELATDQGRSYRTIIFEVLREPMFVMLLAAGAIYFVLGSWHEAALLSLFASFSVLITIVQEMRSENVLKALRNLTSPCALVLRDGVQKRIPGREVVRGDLRASLSEGDRIPADGHLITVMMLWRMSCG